MIKLRSLPSHFELETQSKEWNNPQFIPSSVSRNFQTMLPDMEQPALQTGNLVPALHEKGNVICEAEHCYWFLQFLWCDTTFHPSSEEIQPILP